MRNKILIFIIILSSCSKSAKISEENNNSESYKSIDLEQRVMNNLEIDSSNLVKTDLNFVVTENDIREFYSSYLSSIYNGKRTKVLNEYCTKELLDSLERIELDADPFFRAQDFDYSWLELLVIKEDSIQMNKFIISYNIPSIENEVIIQLWVEKNDKGFLIVKIR